MERRWGLGLHQLIRMMIGPIIFFTVVVGNRQHRRHAKTGTRGDQGASSILKWYFGTRAVIGAIRGERHSAGRRE